MHVNGIISVHATTHMYKFKHLHQYLQDWRLGQTWFNKEETEQEECPGSQMSGAGSVSGPNSMHLGSGPDPACASLGPDPIHHIAPDLIHAGMGLTPWPRPRPQPQPQPQSHACWVGPTAPALQMIDWTSHSSPLWTSWILLIEPCHLAQKTWKLGGGG